MLTRLRQVFAARNNWLLGGFMSFLFLIVVFAFLYYFAYRGDRSRFLFATDIVHRQAVTFTSDATTRLSLLSHAALAVRQAETSVLTGTGSPAPNSGPQRIATSSGLIVVVQRILAGGLPWTTLSVEDSAGHAVHSWDLGPVALSRHAPPTSAALRLYGDIIVRDSSDLQLRLHTVTTDSPDVWSFWDFLYFSVITQGTVGYGDIIPNSTYVRGLVVVQVLSSCLVVLVLLNWVIAPPSPRQ